MSTKILLLGEFSGLNKALKEGLLALGKDVVLAANGDAWKKIDGADFPLYPISKGCSLNEKIRNYIVYPINDERFKNYDIVHAITPYLYYWVLGAYPLSWIKRNNDKLFISAAGNDYYHYMAWKNGIIKYDKYVYEGNKRLIKAFEGKSIKSYILNHTCKRVMNMADGIIPCEPYEYEVPYKRFSNLRKAIPLPINIDNIVYSENVIKGKIVIFHGINRYEDKGSKYILEAMKIIKKRYPDKVECISAEKLPYCEYTNLMNRVNIVIDQCRCFGYGINACISMAKGKVVLSGAEKEVVDLLDKNCPVINIRPDINQIVDCLEYLICNRVEIPVIGYESRNYIIRNHNYIKIAELYFKEWTS